MKTIRAILADDEPVARDLLRGMLASCPDVEVVAECADGEQAVQAIRQERPDVAFLDIRMPRLSGLEAAASLAADETPYIVFVTAFDDFAVRAFELHALDYLLKPFDESRLSRTVERVRESLKLSRAARTAERLDGFLGQLERIGKSIERVAVKQGSETVILSLRDVAWIESEANYVRLHNDRGAHLLRSTLSGIASRLDPARFVQIHRGTIVNVERIERLSSCGRGDYRVVLRDGTELKLSRRFRSRLDPLLGGPD